ncbi:MAG: hypothetical protein QS99_C0001G0031 [archaeon GW2011_AR4]|nr:MAG: hypothetical protein QS99_C0001G0031 [archaeon GW2011_AR4]
MIIFLVPDSSRHIRRSTMVLSRTFVQAIRQYEALAGQVHLVREQSPAIFSSLEELASDDTPSILIRTGRQIEPLSRLIEELNRIERSASSPLERMISERKLARYTREREIVGELEERYMHLFDAYVEEATSRLRGMLGQLKESFDKRDMVLLQASRQEISLLAGAISSLLPPDQQDPAVRQYLQGLEKGQQIMEQVYAVMQSGASFLSARQSLREYRRGAMEVHYYEGVIIIDGLLRQPTYQRDEEQPLPSPAATSFVAYLSALQLPSSAPIANIRDILLDRYENPSILSRLHAATAAIGELQPTAVPEERDFLLRIAEGLRTTMIAHAPDQQVREAVKQTYQALVGYAI